MPDRDAIVDCASGEIDQGVNSGAPDPDDSSYRLGYERLKGYFDVAAPGEWPDSVVEKRVDGLPHWCGIFAVWALKTAGCDVGNWRKGSGIASVRGIRPLGPQTTPQPGDVGYIEQPVQHHCVVESVDDDGTINSIDGNVDGQVVRKSRPRSAYHAFYSAFLG